jgi:ABC-type uncharacterized transport system involved in gliding motility auxiliary subunit
VRLTDDVSDIEAALGAVSFVIFTAVGILKKYGILDKIITKLKIPSDVAIHISKQGADTSIAKLELSDDVVNLLNKYASDENGKIDIDKGALVLNDQRRLKEIIKLKKKRSLTNAEKDEALNIVSRVLCLYRE